MDTLRFRPYAFLLVTFGPDMSYGQKLMALEWREKREQIISRDKCTCRRCGLQALPTEYGYEVPLSAERLATIKEQRRKDLEDNPFIDLLGDGSITIRNSPADVHPFEKIEIHVHHQYYIKGRLPWDYDDDVLITVCVSCHKTIHQEEKILCFDGDDLSNGVALVACSRCGGDGYIEEYNHVQNGICFQCGGKGYLNIVL